MSQLADIQLLSYWIDGLAIRDIQRVDDDNQPDAAVAPRVDWEMLRRKDNEMEHLLRMRIRFGSPKAAGVSGSLELSGVFAATGERPPDNWHVLMAYNAPAILYGIARGVLASLTSQTQEGLYLLPAVNLVEIARRRERRRRHLEPGTAQPDARDR